MLKVLHLLHCSLFFDNLISPGKIVVKDFNDVTQSLRFTMQCRGFNHTSCIKGKFVAIFPLLL